MPSRSLSGSALAGRGGFDGVEMERPAGRRLVGGFAASGGERWTEPEGNDVCEALGVGVSPPRGSKRAATLGDCGFPSSCWDGGFKEASICDGIAGVVDREGTSGFWRDCGSLNVSRNGSYIVQMSLSNRRVDAAEAMCPRLSRPPGSVD